ncbi:MAG TPA: hypothetical protein VFQ44_05135 [Streptosporangiaceae bacterium]|nr:hypothetical protein [Streptosporangiaceae bacterium]
MTFPLTREQADAAARAAASERDTIQSNLLELDASFGKRLLAGAQLTGESRASWDKVSASLASLWDTFAAYSSVIDRATEVLAAPGRLPASRLHEVAGLLNGPSVALTRAVAPLAQRELTAGGQTRLTLQATVREMRASFTSVAAVITAAEAVWNEISDGIRVLATSLESAKREIAGDLELSLALAQAETGLSELRELLNADPLAFWRGGKVDSSWLGRLRAQTAAVASQAAELARIRADAGQRLAEITAALTAAQQACLDAAAARERAATRITVPAYDPLPDISGLASRLDGLRSLQAAGRWTRLAADLDALARETAAATSQCKDAEQAAAGLVERRNELRGLLDAYRAKAGGLGAAENAELDQRYQQARDLLWTAPCDLAAATAAVNGYQQAVLLLRRSGDRS